MLVKLSMIKDNPYQRREHYTDIPELAASIGRELDARPGTMGLLQVPSGRLLQLNGDRWEPADTETAAKVARMSGFYDSLDPDENGWLQNYSIELLFGHRRFRAFQWLAENDERYASGLMPINLVKADEDQMLNAVWSENYDRVDISAVEQAELLQLKLERSSSQREVAESWGLARSTVANRLSLLQLPADVQEANRTGRISERKALALKPIIQLQTVLNGNVVDWNTDHNDPRLQTWDYPPAPQAVVEFLVTKGTDVTSDEIRHYANRALSYAGWSIPDCIAKYTAKPEHADGMVQVSCKGCPKRLNNHCFDNECLAQKKAEYGFDLAEKFAAQHGYKVDDSDQWYSRDVKLCKDLEALHEAGGCKHMVVMFDDNQSRARPESDYMWVSAKTVWEKDGWPGIALGHAGEFQSDCLVKIASHEPEELNHVSDEITPPHQSDLPSRQQQLEWIEAAQELEGQFQHHTIKALAEHLVWESSDQAMGIVTALLNPKAMDKRPEQMARLLVAKLWDYGRGITYDDRHNAATMRKGCIRLINNAGIPTEAAFPNSDEGVKEYAISLLGSWYKAREFTYHINESDRWLVAEINKARDLPGMDAQWSMHLDIAAMDGRWWLTTYDKDDDDE